MPPKDRGTFLDPDQYDEEPSGSDVGSGDDFDDDDRGLRRTNPPKSAAKTLDGRIRKGKSKAQDVRFEVPQFYSLLMV